MNKTLDTIYPFLGLCERASRCRLRVYEAVGYPTVVIVSEVPDNPGTSITQCAEQLATLVWKMLERPEHGLIWLEHYPSRPLGRGNLHTREEFDRVNFTPTRNGFIEPCWFPLSRAEVEALIGQPLEQCDPPARS